MNKPYAAKSSPEVIPEGVSKRNKLAERLATEAMRIFTPESNLDSDDPGGIHSFNQAKRRFKEILDGKP